MFKINDVVYDKCIRKAVKIDSIRKGNKYMVSDGYGLYSMKRSEDDLIRLTELERLIYDLPAK